MKKGFTLLEMMIVVVIIGILAAVALPMYSSYVKKSRTAEAKAALGDIRQAQLAYYEDPSLGNYAFAVDVATLEWTLETGSTTGKAPASYAYDTNATKSTATAGDATAVPPRFDSMEVGHWAGDIAATGT